MNSAYCISIGLFIIAHAAFGDKTYIPGLLFMLIAIIIAVMGEKLK